MGNRLWPALPMGEGDKSKRYKSKALPMVVVWKAGPGVRESAQSPSDGGGADSAGQAGAARVARQAAGERSGLRRRMQPCRRWAELRSWGRQGQRGAPRQQGMCWGTLCL